MTSIHTILAMAMIIISVRCTVEEDIRAVTGKSKYFYAIDKLVQLAYNDIIVPKSE